jgi:ABC-type multidrug transport system fused ATPase/permease subunit
VFPKFKKLSSKILYVSKLTKIKNKKLRILLSVFLANTAVAFDVVIIVVFASILNGEISYDNSFIVGFLDFMISNKALLPILVFFRFLFLFLEKLNIEKLGLDVVVSLRSYLMKETFNKGNLSISDAYFYINQVSGHVSFFYRSFASFINSLVQILGYSIFLFFSEPDIFTIFIFGALTLFIPTKFLLKKGKYYQHLVFTETKNLDRLIQRILDNSFLIKILNTFKYENDIFTETLNRNKTYQINNVVFGSVNSIVPTFTTLFILSILFTFTNFIKIITFEFIGVLLRLFQSLSGFNNGLNLVINSSVHVEELYKLDIESPNIKTQNFSYNPNLDVALEFSNVTFKYFNSENNIFENLDLIIQKNHHLIITGPNGSGKSTLLGLISGLFIPDKGKVELSSNKLGYVGVTPLIINTSIKENLLYGNNSDVSDKEILKLLDRFNFYPDEKKIDISKIISNKTLSSGQMQKISFIRAILNNVDILLLDEATSNLDIESKQTIFSILNEENITIINSTHNKNEFKFDSEIGLTLDKDGKRQLRFL